MNFGHSDNKGNSPSRTWAVLTLLSLLSATYTLCLIPSSSTGKANIVFTIPDTITEWKASVFCLERESGFGISAPTSLTAFQPFFVDLTLPYSIIRGEDFLLRANVFNYLDKCIKVCPLLLSLIKFPGHLSAWLKQAAMWQIC